MRELDIPQFTTDDDDDDDGEREDDQYFDAAEGAVEESYF